MTITLDLEATEIHSDGAQEAGEFVGNMSEGDAQKTGRNKLDTFNALVGPSINAVVKGMEAVDEKAKTNLSPVSYLALKAVPKFIELFPRIGTAAVVAALMAGNPDVVDKDAIFKTACSAGSNVAHQRLCQQIIKLNHLTSEEMMLAAGTARKFQDNPKQLAAIGAIVHASNVTGFDLKTALTLASIESTLGKYVEAKKSSARGVFQYIDGTWMGSEEKNTKGSFQKHAGKPGLESITDLAKRTNSADPAIRAAARQEASELRLNPQIHSLIALYDLAEEHPQMVRKNEVTAASLKREAYNAGLGNAFELMERVRGRLADLVRHDDRRDDPDRQAELAMNEYQKHAITEIYLSHFLGKTGARIFLSQLNDKENRKAKFVPASFKFKSAANANEAIFGNGGFSYVEVYEKLFDKVEMAYDMHDETRNTFAAEYEGRVKAELAARSTIRVQPRTVSQPQELTIGDILARGETQSTRIHQFSPAHDRIGQKLLELGIAK